MSSRARSAQRPARAVAAPRRTPARSPRRRAAPRRRGAFALLAALVLVAGGVALVWPLLHHAVKEFTLPLRHEDIIRQQAADKGIRPELIAGVIYAESKFTDQTSSAGAKGLMQITPDTAKYIARLSGGTSFELSDLSTPQVNISYGAYYLRYLLKRYGGNEVLALAAYNAGEGNVDRWIVDSGRKGKAFTAADIPFAETRAYVDRVQRATRDYAREYRSELGL